MWSSYTLEYVFNLKICILQYIVIFPQEINIYITYIQYIHVHVESI